MSPSRIDQDAKPSAVRLAERDLLVARRRLAEVLERAKTDPEVTAQDITDAEATVRLAGLRLTGSRQLVIDQAEAERQRKAEAGERGRRRRQEQARREQLANEQRAIESGKAETGLRELAQHSHSPDAAKKLRQVATWKAQPTPRPAWRGYDVEPEQ